MLELMAIRLIQGLLRFQECLNYDPDIVLISFGANDGHQVRTSDRDYSSKQKGDSSFQNFVKRFRLGKLILFVLNQKWNDNSRGLVCRVSVQEYRQNLESMISIAQENRIQPVLLTRPYIGTGRDPSIWKYYAPLYYEATKQIATNHGILLIDVYELFKGKNKYFADESHFTHAGHRVAAGYIYAALKPLIPISQSSDSSSGTTSGAFTSGSSSRTKTPR
jgi:lysophospholipase L1-like esterase